MLAATDLEDDPVTDTPDRDDSLALLLMCCHPSLTPASAIALTLRAVGGLTTTEVAAAFLVPDATMGQRISRAKSTIRASGIPFAVPAPGDLPARIEQVLRVIYLVYNQAHASIGGDSPTRVDLAAEAIRLARGAHELLPDDAEVAGLLALLLLLDARRPTRMTADGNLVPLAEQDRSRWNRGQIAEGTAILDAAIARGAVGEYQLQAAIAALHDRAPTAAETDWPQILALYGLLERMTGSPIVTLNRAVATRWSTGPRMGCVCWRAHPASSATTTDTTPCADGSSSSSVTSTARSTPISRPRHEPRAWPSSDTSGCSRRASGPDCERRRATIWSDARHPSKRHDLNERGREHEAVPRTGADGQRPGKLSCARVTCV